MCDFCYKEAFFEGGRSFYTQTVDAALAEIERLPGRHLYFLDDHLFGDRRFASALFDGMRGMGRLWQAAGTVNAVLAPGLLERAVDAGLRSLFVGFETLNPANLAEQRKYQNMRRDYAAAIRRLHDLGVMINGSFVFGMDGDDGVGVRAHRRVGDRAGHRDGDVSHPHAVPGHGALPPHGGSRPPHDSRLGSLRHAPRRLPPGAHVGRRARIRVPLGLSRVLPLEIDRRAAPRRTSDLLAGLRHLAYSAGWKKFEPLWDFVIRAKRAGTMLPVLETILSEFGRRPAKARESGASVLADWKIGRVADS